MRFKDRHYPDLLKNMHFAKLYNGVNATPSPMGDLNEVFILDNIAIMQEFNIVPKEVDLYEYDFVDNKVCFGKYEFFFTKENDFVMTIPKKGQYFVLRVK